jgi:hypothetical protein
MRLSGAAAMAGEAEYPFTASRRNAVPIILDAYALRERVQVRGTVVTPAAPVLPATTVTTEVLGYRVKEGHRFFLSEVVLNYVGAGFTAGLGDIIWLLDRNAPTFIASPMAARVKGFEMLDFPAGSFQIPWRLEPPEIFQPGDHIRSKVITTAAIPAGSPNLFISVFKGWLVPIGES